jgi:DinB superfamily
MAAEPWLRGTLTEVGAVQRAVLHAFEMAAEDLELWCGALSDEEVNARPHGIAPVAFHLRHIPRSLDRLITYAEGGQLSSEQLVEMKSELEGGATKTGLFDEFKVGLERAKQRVQAFSPGSLEDARGVGRKMLPTSVAGLLVHCADHTQRHVGQAVTTAKVLVGMRQEEFGDTISSRE